jgi:hypothetical protein
MSAVISECEKYRYRLERHGLSGAGAVAWIMVNPSTADAETDDATIRKVIGFSERLGFGWLIVVNLYGLRATDVRRLAHVPDPIGPLNDEHVKRASNEAITMIAAWGPLAKQPPPRRNRRWKAATAKIGRPLMCLGVAKDGHPRHPLMLPYDTPLVPWTAP